MIKAAAISIFLLNFIAGLLFMNEALFHHDSVVLARAVENTYKTGTLQPAVRGRYGSVILSSVVHLPFAVFGKKADFSVRLSSVLFHALSIAAIFIFLNEFFGDFILALFSSLLVSFVPLYFSPDTYGKEHGASIFFLAMSFYLVYRAATAKSVPLAALSSMVFVFSVTIRESMLAMAPLFFLLYFSPEVTLRPLRVGFAPGRFDSKMLLSLLIPFAACLGFVLFSYLGNEIRLAFMPGEASSRFLGPFSRIIRLSLHDLFFGLPLAVFILSIFGLILLFARKNIFPVLFFLCWFLTIFYFGNISCYCVRYLDLVVIPVCVSAACALAFIYAKYRLIALSLLACCMVLMFSDIYPILSYRRTFNGEKQFALFVKEKTPENAIIIAMDDSVFIEYYGLRKCITYPPDQAGLDRFILTISGYLRNNVPVYFSTGCLYGYDRKNILRRALRENFNLKLTGAHLAEDYHRAEVSFQTYSERLYKVELKK